MPLLVTGVIVCSCARVMMKLYMKCKDGGRIQEPTTNAFIYARITMYTLPIVGAADFISFNWAAALATGFFFFFLLVLKTTSGKCEAAFLTFIREETSDAFSCESWFIPYCFLVCLHLPEY